MAEQAGATLARMSTLYSREALGQALAAEGNVRLGYLFGSVARGAGRSDSDVDIAVLMDDEAVAGPGAVKHVIWRLSDVLGKIVGSHRLDLVILNRAPVLLRHRVIRDGIVLHARDDNERARFVRRTLRDHQDIEPRLREHLRRRITRLREGRTHGRCGDLLATARRAGRLLAAPEKPG